MSATLQVIPVNSGPDAAPFLTMTFPDYWTRLLGRQAGLPLVAVALREGEPLALALAERRPEGAAARLLSLYVVPARRRQGLGTRLLQGLEDALRGEAIHEVYAAYTDSVTGRAGIEAIFRRQGWSAPQPDLILARAGTEAIPALRSTPALRRRSLPVGYTYGRWEELTEADVAQLHTWREQGVIPAYIDPFVEATPPDPVCSLTLRHEGNLLGFLLTHRTSAQVLRYTSLWVHPEIPVKGLGLYLAVEAVHRQIESETLAAGEEMVCATHAGTPLAEFWQRRWFAAIPQMRLSQSLLAGKYLDDSATAQIWSGRQGLSDLSAG